MTRAPLRHQTKPRHQPGDVQGSWTFVQLIEDVSSSHLRRWLMRCACGYQARKFEVDTTPSRGTACATCARKLSAKKQEKNDAKDD